MQQAEDLDEYIEISDGMQSYDSDRLLIRRLKADVLSKLSRSDEAKTLLQTAADVATRSSSEIASRSAGRAIENRRSVARDLLDLNAPDAAVEQYRLATDLQRRVCAVNESPEELSTLCDLLLAAAKIYQAENELAPADASPLLQEARQTYARICELEPEDVEAYQAQHDLFETLAGLQTSDENAELPPSLRQQWLSFVSAWAEQARGWSVEATAVTALGQVAADLERLKEAGPAIATYKEWLARKEAMLRESQEDLSQLVVDYYNAAAACSRLKDTESFALLTQRCYELCQEVLGLEKEPQIVIQVYRRYAALKQQQDKTDVSRSVLASLAQLKLPEAEDQIKRRGAFLADRLNDVADSLEERKAFEQAEGIRRHRLEMERRLFALEADTENRVRISKAWQQLSENLTSQNKQTDAMEALTQAYTIAREGIAAEPTNNLRIQMGDSGIDLGDLLIEQQRFDEVEAIYDEVSMVLDEMAANGDDDAWQRNLSSMLHYRAMLEFHRGNIPAALQYAERRLPISLPLFEDNPDDSNKDSAASSYDDLAYLKIFAAEPDAVVQSALAGREIDPERVGLALILTYAYLLQGEDNQARSIFEPVKDKEWKQQSALEYLHQLTEDLQDRELPFVPLEKIDALARSAACY